MPTLDPRSVPTHSFEWGSIKWALTKADNPEAGMTVGTVIMQPGEGHGRHNHPGAAEFLYVIAGHGEQMTDDGEPFPVGPGDMIYIEPDVYHSTKNTGWEPMHVLAIYAPGGSEEALNELPDHRLLAPGEVPAFRRA